MHSELQKAIDEAAKLSDDEEALGHWLFEEIALERRWDEFFLRSYESLAA